MVTTSLCVQPSQALNEFASWLAPPTSEIHAPLMVPEPAELAAYTRCGTAVTSVPLVRSSFAEASVLAPSQGDPVSFLHLTISLTSRDPLPAGSVAVPLHRPVPALKIKAAPFVPPTSGS